VGVCPVTARQLADTVREFLSNASTFPDSKASIALSDLVAVAERAEQLEEALRETLDAYIEATDHITQELQPEFVKVANGERLTWPSSENYDVYSAGMRLATWWHGCNTEDVIAKARAALVSAGAGKA
jgi:hypothetical protein